MKKTALIALGLSLVSLDAQAISRYNSTSMSCDEVRARIRHEGAVIMRWRSPRNPSIQRYGRFVAHDGFCPASEIAETTWIPAADTQSCPVYECHQYDPEDDLFWLRRHH